MRVSVFGTINAQGGVLCKVTKVIIDSCRGAGSIYAHGINYLDERRELGAGGASCAKGCHR